MTDQNATQSLLEKVLPPTITLIFTAGFSVLVGVYLEKFKNKLIFLKYNIFFSPLGITMQDNILGNIQVTHNGRPIKYLNLVTIDIINDSNNDVPKEIFVDIWVNPVQSQILSLTGNYNIIGNAIFLEEKYITRFNKTVQWLEEEEKKKESNPSYEISNELRQEIEWVQSNKKLHLPIFNRNSSAKITLLVESFDNNKPVVSVSILQTSVKLIKQEDSEIQKKKRLLQTNIVQVIINVIGLIFILIKYPDSKLIILYTIIVGFVSYIIAKLIILLFRFLKRMFW